MTRRRLALGAAGEEQAARWYSRRHYRVVERNWRCPAGEVDLILLAPDGVLVVAEVKTRSSLRYGAPAEAVTVAKQRRLRGLATLYLRDGGAPPHRGVRFDVVSIVAGEIDVLEGAF